MSAIPPNWLASGIQGHGAQKRAVEERDRDAAQQTRTAGGSTFSHELIDVVESSDRDAQADADAEGAGSQGKAFSDAESEDQAADSNPPTAGADDGLDIQA